MEKSSVVESIIEITDDTKQLEDKIQELEYEIKSEIKEINTKVNLLFLLIIITAITAMVN